MNCGAFGVRCGGRHSHAQCGQSTNTIVRYDVRRDAADLAVYCTRIGQETGTWRNRSGDVPIRRGTHDNHWRASSPVRRRRLRIS